MTGTLQKDNVKFDLSLNLNVANRDGMQTCCEDFNTSGPFKVGTSD